MPRKKKKPRKTVEERRARNRQKIRDSENRTTAGSEMAKFAIYKAMLDANSETNHVPVMTPVVQKHGRTKN